MDELIGVKLQDNILTNAKIICDEIYKYDFLYKTTKSLYNKTRISYEKYKKIAAKIDGSAPQLLGLDSFVIDFGDYVLIDERRQFAEEIINLNESELLKFFAGAPVMSGMLVKEEKNLADNLSNMVIGLNVILKRNIKLLFESDEDSLFAAYYILARDIKANGGEIIALIRDLDNLNALAVELNKYEYADIDLNKLSSMIAGLNDGGTTDTFNKALLNNTGDEIQEALERLSGLTDTILSFAGLTEDEASDFYNTYNNYRSHLKNNFSKENARTAIRAFENEYIKLYEKVYFASVEKQQRPKPVKLFLDYGIISEKDFKETDIVNMYFNLPEKQENSGYNIFSMSEWLDMIYEGKREPSKSEMDEDYRDNLITLKKRKSFTKQEEDAYLNDFKGKVQYEISNFFRSNMRILFASNSTFCPFVYGDILPRGINEMALGFDKLAGDINTFKAIDFSIFYRTFLYRVEGPKSENLQLQTEVLPDFIILPIAGQRGSMWQEISDRKRVSPARFVLPMFPLVKVTQMLPYMMGKYRWEFCRTDAGTRWNDITEPSLTSEFYDYMMYYKKNHDLSDQVKQKLKDKMNQYRNNISEIFINDYIAWLLLESTGASRLNKVSRSIIGKYVPFTKGIRDKLSSNPMFADVMRHEEAFLTKKYRELTAHYQSLTNAGNVITDELKENLEYYSK